MTYVSAMPKKSPREKLFEWRVVRIKSTPAAIVGYVQAPDAEQAIKAAIERYEISSPIEQARLAAQCVKEIG
jgi:predicted chitinase